LGIDSIYDHTIQLDFHVVGADSAICEVRSGRFGILDSCLNPGSIRSEQGRIIEDPPQASHRRKRWRQINVPAKLSTFSAWMAIRTFL
jgi:hypothetical protein